MAAAEARTAWPRTARRCYVHEDAMEAPKFSSCPSSSYSSNSESDHAPNIAAKEPHNTIPDYLPPYPNSDGITNRRWWLNQEPNFGRQKDFMIEQQISLEAELEILSNGYIVNKAKDINGENQFITQTAMKSNVNSSIELRAVTCNSPQNNATGKDVRDFWYLNDHMMNLDSLDCFDSQKPKKVSSEFVSHWVGADKTGPWWRTAGKHDLASLVAQKSLEHFENCDLPRPQAKHYKKQPSACSQSLDSDDILAKPLDRLAETESSNMDYTWGSPISGSSPNDSEQSLSCNSGHTKTSTASINKPEAQDNSENDQNKAQLLKALCLSQKRAREAEKAANQAYTEKEHIITLLFRQASQLFAYKQWLQLLQLENICLQLKNKNQPISDLFPSVLPWLPCKGEQVKKGQHRAGNGRKRHRKPRHEISKCAVAFAVGLGLASAGLLLGWTMGWLFPTV